MWQWVQRHVTCKNHANMDQPSMTRKSSEQTNGVNLELLALCRLPRLLSRQYGQIDLKLYSQCRGVDEYRRDCGQEPQDHGPQLAANCPDEGMNK